MTRRRKKTRGPRVYRYGRKEALDVLLTFKKAVLARQVGTVLPREEGSLWIEWHAFGCTYLWLEACPRNRRLWAIFVLGQRLPWPLRGPFPEIQNGG